MHYSDVIIGAMAYQITGISIVCSTVGSGADQRKQQSSASLAFVRGIHRLPVISPHKRPVTRKCFHLMTSSCVRLFMSNEFTQGTSLSLIVWRWCRVGSWKWRNIGSGNCSIFIWWRHQIETFPALLAICAGNLPVRGEFPTQSQWRGALTFSLICARINGWYIVKKLSSTSVS